MVARSCMWGSCLFGKLIPHGSKGDQMKELSKAVTMVTLVGHLLWDS